MNIIYEGIFFDNKNTNIIKSLDFKKYNNKVSNPHITFKINPNINEIYNNLENKEYAIKIIGYGFDNNNFGLEVQLPDELLEYYDNKDKNNNIIVPHITTSYTDNSNTKNTKNLKFRKLEKPIIIKGNFKYYIKDNNKNHLVDTISNYEKKSLEK